MSAMLRGCVSVSVGLLVALGCTAPRAVPLPEGVDPRDVSSVPFESAAVHAAIVPLADSAEPGAKHDILLLSGGGSYGAYQAGVVCGWSDAGAMPEFSVVTGISAGSLLAVAVFAGSEYLPEIRRLYTELSQKNILRGDLWLRRHFPHPFGIGADSFASDTRFRANLRRVLDSPGYFEKIAAAHAKGRRLYIGTTNLDTETFVPWDMGAIASRGTPESRKLYEDIILASCAIPLLFPPVRIPVTIDGKCYEEMHADGFVTRNLFFYPPSDWPGDAEDGKTGLRMLAGARVYAVVAGKLYNEPAGIKPSRIGIGLRTVESQMASLQRADLARIHSQCVRRGMILRVAAIPNEYAPIYSPIHFDPVQMTKLFCTGYTQAQSDRVWNRETPERSVGEERARTGSVLTSQPTDAIGPLGIGRFPAAK